MGKSWREELVKIMETNLETSSNYLVAKEILSELNRSVSLNSTIIAKNSGKSRPTVIRFAQAFGFAGFKEFATELRKQDEFYYFEQGLKDYQQSFDDYRHLLKLAFSKVNLFSDTLIEIAKEIQDKQRIFIFASPENILLGNNFADQLRYLGIEVFNANVLDKQPFLLNHVEKHDLVLFLVSGFDNDTLSQMWTRINSYTKTILITVNSKQDKFLNPNYLVLFPIIQTPLRANVKQFLFTYIFDQIFNLLIFSDQEFMDTIIQPKYRF